jgi:hypothetical protein
MVTGTPDNTQAGFIDNEAVTLSTLPTGTTYEWGLAKPQGATARSNLTATTGTGVQFIPDVAGTWTITCTVDGTTAYALRISVLQVAVTTWAHAYQLPLIADASVPAPATGATFYYSSDRTAVALKVPSGDVFSIEIILPVSRVDVGDSPYTPLSIVRTIFADTDGGDVTVLLLPGADGLDLRIVNTGTSGNDVIVTPNGAELLLGVAASQTLTDGQQIHISYETTEGWW